MLVCGMENAETSWRDKLDVVVDDDALVVVERRIVVAVVKMMRRALEVQANAVVFAEVELLVRPRIPTMLLPVHVMGGTGRRILWVGTVCDLL